MELHHCHTDCFVRLLLVLVAEGEVLALEVLVCLALEMQEHQ